MPFGLNVTAMKPGYGLAEHTVYVSDGGDCVRFFNKLQLEAHNTAVEVCDAMPLAELANMPAAEWHRTHAPPSSEQYSELDACGLVTKNLDVSIVIVEPDSCQLVTREGGVGEIWLHSASMAGGYWNLPDVSAAAFGARLAADDADGEVKGAASGDARGYLRTGDLGCVVGGHLFVVGRIKDMIIVRGRNHYPQVRSRALSLPWVMPHQQ